MTRTHRTSLLVFWTSAALLGLGARGAEPAAPAGPALLKLQAVPFTQVQIIDRFWSPRRDTNRLASIPINLEMLKQSGNFENFALAAAGKKEGFRGPVFMDSDVYKALEAAAFSLATHPDPALSKRLDEIIALIASAQEPSGYVNTHFQVKEPAKKWTNLRDWHELYCAGHMIEAAVAHYQATGQRNFLQVATRCADHIDSLFGAAPGKRMGYPGHPEIELALVKLSRATGEHRYFELARFFVENRGRKFFAEEHHTPLDRYQGDYWQDDVPICDHRQIKGHAVRACYLMSGATDVAAETGNAALLRMLQRVWRNTTLKRMYLTGGIGPSAHNEGFTEDYDLPNLTAYQETCASIALAQWNHRLALLYGDAQYADVYERSLYNGVLAGVSLDGTRFFYVNPLASEGHHHRSPWFGCACCPPNVARTLASLGGYAYAVSDRALWVNLYIQGTAKANVGGQDVTLQVTTDYPWDGQVVLKPQLAQRATFELRLRVPGWCDGATVAVNRKKIAEPVIERGYLVLAREWKAGDIVALDLPMPVRRIASHPKAGDNLGRTALQRGPLVYCLEAVDQREPLSSLYLPLEAELKPVREPALLGGVVTLQGSAAVAGDMAWMNVLYQPAPASRRVPITAIPYYAWDNRKAGAMQVWLPMAPPAPKAGGLESQAKVTVSFANNNAQPDGINDGIEPRNSGEQPAQLCHWWPHKNRQEWAQYTWPKPVTVAGAKTYWFDDTGRGACRLPASWQLQFLDGSEWKPVSSASAYPVAKDRWCEVTFTPVTTAALRLLVTLPPEWASGVHEWKVVEAED